MSAMQYGQDSTMPVTFPTPQGLVNTSIQNLPATITIPSELLQERLQEGSMHGSLSTYLPYMEIRQCLAYLLLNWRAQNQSGLNHTLQKVLLNLHI